MDETHLSADFRRDATSGDASGCRMPVHRSRVLRLSWLTAVLLLLSGAGSGCATLSSNHFYAHDLPAEYIAPTNDNPQLIDFTKLSGATGNSEIIGAGDVLDVSISANLNSKDLFTFASRVGEDGQANLSLVGPVRLAGMELEDAEAAITQACIDRGLFVAPHVTVTTRRKKTNRIMVVGAVKSPGLKNIPIGESDLLSVLFHAGGLADDAGTSVEIRNVLNREEAMSRIAGIASGPGHVRQTGYSVTNETPKSMKIDLVSAAREGTNAYYVGDGGVVMVEKRDPKAVHVLGLVRKPGRFDFPVTQDLYVLDALALAGHTTSQVADKIYVIRQMQDTSDPAVIRLSISRAKQDPSHNVRLAPGDIISVEHTPATILLEALTLVRFGLSGSINPLLF